MKKTIVIILAALALMSCGKSNKRDLTVATENPKYRYVCIEQQGYTVNGQFYYYNGYMVNPNFKTICRYY